MKIGTFRKVYIQKSWARIRRRTRGWDLRIRIGRRGWDSWDKLTWICDGRVRDCVRDCVLWFRDLCRDRCWDLDARELFRTRVILLKVSLLLDLGEKYKLHIAQILLVEIFFLSTNSNETNWNVDIFGCCCGVGCLVLCAPMSFDCRQEIDIGPVRSPSQGCWTCRSHSRQCAFDAALAKCSWAYDECCACSARGSHCLDTRLADFSTILCRACISIARTKHFLSRNSLAWCLKNVYTESVEWRLFRSHVFRSCIHLDAQFSLSSRCLEKYLAQFRLCGIHDCQLFSHCCLSQSFYNGRRRCSLDYIADVGIHKIFFWSVSISFCYVS